MCPRKESNRMETDDVDLQEVIDNINFIFVSHGLVLCVLVIFGLILNLLCLGVLCRKQFKSAPYCLLQALTMGAVLVLGFSIYSDIHPAIASRRQLHESEAQRSKLVDSLQTLLATRYSKCAVNTTSNITEMFISEDVLKLLLSSQEAKSSKNTGFSSDRRSKPQYTTVWNQSLLTSSSPAHADCSVNKTGSSSPAHADCSVNKTGMTRPNFKQRKVNSQPIRQATERFVAYFTLTFNMFIVAGFGFERLFVVLRPIKARVALTVRRTRYAILIVVIACFAIHTPQLLKEIITSICHPQLMADDFQGTLLQSYRRHYEEFLTYLTSSLLVLILVTNCALIVAVCRYRRRVRQEAGSSLLRSEERQNLNITYVILLLVFCHLPQGIVSNVVTQMAMAKMLSNITLFTRLFVVSRVLYVTNSACSCLVYCLLAQKFRRAFLNTYFWWCFRGRNLKTECADQADKSRSAPSSPSSLSTFRLRYQGRASPLPHVNVTSGFADDACSLQVKNTSREK